MMRYKVMQDPWSLTLPGLLKPEFKVDLDTKPQEITKLRLARLATKAPAPGLFVSITILLLCILESSGGGVVTALASHRCGPGSSYVG